MFGVMAAGLNATETHESAYFWTSTSSDAYADRGVIIGMNFPHKFPVYLGTEGLAQDQVTFSHKLSVRCIADISLPAPPRNPDKYSF